MVRYKEGGFPHLPRFVPAPPRLLPGSRESQWMKVSDTAVQAGSFVLILAMSELNTHLYLSCQPVPFSNFVLMWKEQIKCRRKKRVFQLWLTVSANISALVL